MNFTDIDLKSLQVLEALIAEKNVTKAAERVGLSQPAVGQG
jgi:DNA-binding transcriptional LysR family regulator